MNERYWRVLKDSAAAATSGTPDACFYSRLGAFLRARKGASACVATTNIDGLAGRWLDAGGAPCTALELHGSVLRLQCATRGAPCCDSVRPTPLEDVAASTSASECEWSCVGSVQPDEHSLSSASALACAWPCSCACAPSAPRCTRTETLSP